MTRVGPEQVAAWETRALEARRGLHAPDGWPRANPPLRIVIFGWACLSLQAAEGSGYNLSVSEFAAGLAACGHHVYYLRSGMDYSLRRGMWVRPREFWRGVGCFDFVNSPNLATANWNFANVTGQTSSPEQTELVIDWVRAIRPDIFHIHSNEGFGLDLIPALRRLGRPVVVTPHNYYFLCPQVDLLQDEKRVCEDYEGGRRCTTCLSMPSPASEVRRRKLRQSGRKVVGHGTVWNFNRALDFFRRHVRENGNGHAIPIVPPPQHANGQLPPPRMPPSPPDQNERLLKSPHHLTVLNNYGDRRQAGVAALNAASAILAPSRFLASVHEAMGVQPALLRHIQLGQPHFDAIEDIARASPFYHREPWHPGNATRPLRFAYFGSTKYNKGLDTLTRAIALVPPDLLAKAHFSIRAQGNDQPFRDRLRNIPQVSFLGGYDLTGLLASIGEFDVGLLPTMGLENSPFVLLEHLHAGKFVIASRLGGPTDWIDEGRNGILFNAGDPDALAAAISAVIRGDVSIPTPKHVREASRLQSFPEYLASVQQVYTELTTPSFAAPQLEPKPLQPAATAPTP